METPLSEVSFKKSETSRFCRIIKTILFLKKKMCRKFFFVKQNYYFQYMLETYYIVVQLHNKL